MTEFDRVTVKVPVGPNSAAYAVEKACKRTHRTFALPVRARLVNGGTRVSYDLLVGDGEHACKWELARLRGEK